MGYRMGGNLWGSATHWNSTAAAAGQAAHPVAQDAILLEGDDPLAVLPAQSKIVNAAVVAALDGQLLCVHVYPSLSATHHTTETENSHGNRVLLSEHSQF